MRTLPLIGLLAIPLLAQPAPRFEVASVRPSQPITPELLKQGLPIGKKVDGDRVSIGFVNMAGLLMWAYDVQDYQITGPDWIHQQRFDISATMPSGTTERQFSKMLRSLLEERFHLKTRTELRDHDAYLLEQSPSRSKLKEVQLNTADQPPSGGITPTTASTSANGEVFRSAEGVMRRTQGPDGIIHVQWDTLTIAQFVEKLASSLEAPVSDRTNLSGMYTITLDYPPGQGSQDLVSTVTDSVERQGLKLRREKAKIDHIVIESVDRTPTEN